MQIRQKNQMRQKYCLTGLSILGVPKKYSNNIFQTINALLTPKCFFKMTIKYGEFSRAFLVCYELLYFH